MSANYLDYSRSFANKSDRAEGNREDSQAYPARKPRPPHPYWRQGRADGGRHRPNVYGIPCCSRPAKRGCGSRFNMHMSAGDVPPSARLWREYLARERSGTRSRGHPPSARLWREYLTGEKNIRGYSRSFADPFSFGIGPSTQPWRGSIPAFITSDPCSSKKSANRYQDHLIRYQQIPESGLAPDL
jgi:hypothetical protein